MSQRTYLVRTNCEYSLEVEASDPQEAMELASKVDYEHWNQAWACYEAEWDEDDPVTGEPCSDG